MSRQQNQPGSNLIDRVLHQNERRALEQARRVPWKRLAEAADEYTEWQVFSLWLRAVVDAAQGVPAVASQEIESKAPQLLNRIRSDVKAAVTSDSPGTTIWQDVTQWLEVNAFTTARKEGWLQAIQYFSSVSLRSIQAWSHWEETDKRWRVVTPKQFPAYAEWRREVAAVTCLSNPDCAAQRLLDCTRAVPEVEWDRLLVAFSDLIAFSLWMELVLDLVPPDSRLVAKELAKKYSGFRLAGGAIGSKEAVRSLNRWAIKHGLGLAGQEHILASLGFFVSHHPAYYALRSYALHCHSIWPEDCLDHTPLFSEWREAADAYFET